MKKLLLGLLLISGLASAQTVNGVDITKDVKAPFINVVITRVAFTTKTNVSVDFGQPTQLLAKRKEKTAILMNGKRLRFNSPIAVLNFFLAYDYVLESTNVVPVGNTSYVFYTLKNPNAASSEQIFEEFKRGIYTVKQ